MLIIPETRDPAIGEVSFSAVVVVLEAAIGLETDTVIEELPITLLFEPYAVAEIVWLPLETLVVSQVMVEGGVLA